MIVNVCYYDESARAYSSKPYTYYCDIPVAKFQKVLAPISGKDGTVLKKALVVETDLPEYTIGDSWKDKVKTITKYDIGE